MTTPADIRWLLARVQNSANVIEARLPHAETNTIRNQADGYPATASGNANQGGRSKAELTPTEAAAHTNLGDLQVWTSCNGDPMRDIPCTVATHIDGDGRHNVQYKPGPATQLADLADHLDAALKSLDRCHDQLTRIGVPPLVTQSYRCRGVNGQGCDGWIDTNRQDHLCIDCGRSVDTNARRLRRHRAS
jgi:hypothetical protein